MLSNFIMTNKIRVGYLGWFNPKDRKASSGTPYKIAEALEKIGCEIKWIPVRRNIIYKAYSKIIPGLIRISKKKFDATHSVIGAYLQSKSIRQESLSDCDLIFAPFSSEALFCIKKERPIIYLSDATFNVMVDYYFKNLTSGSIKQGNQVEQRALSKSDAIIVSSDWAAKSVINDYKQPEEKVYVIEFGANIDDEDIIPHKFEYDGHLNLLFLGVDWERKGGSIAVDTCRWLNDNGIKTTLHVIGTKRLNDKIKNLPFVDYVGFLNKNSPEQYEKLVSIIKKCHCLLLPTLAECSAIAFCESSANGLPIFSHVTGGVKNYVEDGRNGYLLPIGSTGADFGRKIKECLETGELGKMSETSKTVYKEKLNWDVWANKVEKIICNLKGFKK